MLIDETGPNSHLSEILCLTLLSVRLMKIRAKIKSLYPGQCFPHYMSMRDYKASNSHMNSPICTKIEHVQDFITVLIICKSNENSIKYEIAIIRTQFS